MKRLALVALLALLPVSASAQSWKKPKHIPQSDGFWQECFAATNGTHRVLLIVDAYTGETIGRYAPYSSGQFCD